MKIKKHRGLHKLFKRLTRLAVLLAFGLVALSVSYALPAYASAPNNCSWTGAQSNEWSVAANWSGCGGTHPQDGDNLIFDNTGLGEITTLNNDLANLQAGSITLTGSGNNSYYLNGNDISLSGGIDNTAGMSEIWLINLNIKLTADQTFADTGRQSAYYVAQGKSIIVGSHNLTITDGNYLIVYGDIIGDGTVRVATGGSASLVVASANFTGKWIISGNTTLSIANPDQLGTASVTVENGSQLRIVTSDTGDTIHTIANDITVSGINGLLINNMMYAYDIFELSGTITLLSDVQVNLGGMSSLYLTGKLVTNGHALTTYDAVDYVNNAYGYHELLNAESSRPVTILTPQSTLLDAQTAIKESSLSAQDTGYDYPLGLVNYTFSNAAASNQVVLIFVTDLTPSQVIARKYNAITKQYNDIPGATITATTFSGNPALRLTYDITDGGPLDQDGTVNGTIIDPVGLATVASAASSGSNSQSQSTADSSSTPQQQSNSSSPDATKAPDTGYGAPVQLSLSITVLAIVATTATSAGLAMLRGQNRSKN
ncbi:MAG: hypothetical protein JWM37_66 [Candidatus Saccharibacteria bacterium]|nr:hypothetical protein [Candidatus Saccharibacteria bacterium]